MSMPAGFFDAIRPLWNGKLLQSVVDGTNAILDVSGALPVTYRAYMLATAYHETAREMQPITERGGRFYFEKYEPGTALGHRLGNTHVGDGFLFRGRGLVQITGRANYAKAGAKLGVLLEQSPDLALDPHIAAQIMLHGMQDGWFTGKALSDYLPGNYSGARRIINGTDKAATIAGYARTFEAALAA
jgi:hypothetical protein